MSQNRNKFPLFDACVYSVKSGAGFVDNLVNNRGIRFFVRNAGVIRNINGIFKNKPFGLYNKFHFSPSAALLKVKITKVEVVPVDVDIGRRE
jgi:hypothetical protein